MRMDYFSDLVEQAIEGAKVDVTGDGSKFEAQVISEQSNVTRLSMPYSTNI